MYDKSEGVLEKYDFNVQEVMKGRGITILRTDKGLMALKEYKGSGKHLVWSNDIIEQIDRNGILKVDCCIRNNEGELITETSSGAKFIIKKWHAIRECDVKKTEDLCLAVRGLAILHNEMEKYKTEEKLYLARELNVEFEAHNKELKKVKKYLYGKNNRTEFEIVAANVCDEYIEEGNNAMRLLKDFMANNKIEKGLCHGNYNYHNICFEEDVPVIINFDKLNYNYLMCDLYAFLRKIMEKSDWDISLGETLINEYNKERRLTDNDIALMAILLSYPEKFWKLINGYFNSGKAWIPRKKLEKLNKYVKQNQLKHEFIKAIH